MFEAHSARRGPSYRFIILLFLRMNTRLEWFEFILLRLRHFISSSLRQVTTGWETPTQTRVTVRSPLAPASSVTPRSTWPRRRGGSVTLEESGIHTLWERDWNEEPPPTRISTASGRNTQDFIDCLCFYESFYLSDFTLYCLWHHRSYSSMQDCRGIYTGCPTVLSSPSSEELTQDQGDRVSLDAADSGRGSWTSCSSGSHDNIQTMQQGRSWETLAFGSGGGGGIGGLPPGGPEALLGGPAALWAAQARGSWASASSSSSSAAYWGEDSEGDTGTIKRRGGKDVNADPETSSITSTGSEEAKQLGRPSPSPITAGGKGLLCESPSFTVLLL